MLLDDVCSIGIGERSHPCIFSVFPVCVVVYVGIIGCMLRIVFVVVVGAVAVPYRGSGAEGDRKRGVLGRP